MTHLGKIMNLANTSPEQALLTALVLIIVAAISAGGTVAVAKITSKNTRKSIEESNEIAEKNVGIAERNQNLAELRVIIEELKEAMKSQREEIKAQRDELSEAKERLDANERDIKIMKTRNSKIIDYLRHVLSVIDRHNLRSEVSAPPEELELDL